LAEFDSAILEMTNQITDLESGLESLNSDYKHTLQLNAELRRENESLMNEAMAAKNKIEELNQENLKMQKVFGEKSINLQGTLT
jgi:peptidoglycan hydrolase CwlO-like protein